MERTGAGDGVALRPNNCLASVPGPAGLVSGGNGSGLRVPLSCAFAVPYTHVRTVHKVSAAFVTASGATLMTTDPGAPLGTTISARFPPARFQVHLRSGCGSRLTIELTAASDRLISCSSCWDFATASGNLEHKPATSLTLARNNS